MDREIPKNIQIRNTIFNYIKIIGVFVLLVIAFGMFRKLIFPKIARNNIQTAIVERGDIEGAITASGIVVPEFEQVLTSPIQSKIKNLYFHSGETVLVDSSIMKLDTEAAEDELQKLSDELQLKRNKLERLTLEMDNNLADLETSYDIQKLQMKALTNNVEIKKQLAEIGVCTTQDLEQAELEKEIAARQLLQLEDRIKNEKKSQKIDISDLQLQIRIQQTEINTLQRKLNQARVCPEFSGVLAWVNDNIGATINQGDEIAKIADLSSFKVEAKISDMHADKLITGNPVKVRVGQQELTGNISGIQPAIENGVITFTVRLDDKKNTALRPNLRVDVFVITSSKKDVLRVKNGAFVKGSGYQEIFFIQGNEAIRKPVKIGAMNFDWVEIIDGANEGDVVIISDMEDHSHKNRLKLK